MLQLHCFSTPFGTKGEDANHFWSHFFFFFFGNGKNWPLPIFCTKKLARHLLTFFFLPKLARHFHLLCYQKLADIHLLCNTIFFLQIKHMTIFFVIAKNWQLNIYKIQNNINKSMITAPLKNFHTFISPENNCIHIDILVCCSPLGTDCFT